MNARSKRPQRPWLNYALGVALVAAIVVAYTSVGQASPSTTKTRRTATVAEGVVQSTVSGSGTLQPASKVAVDFASSGTLTGVFVKVGEHVKKGELLAEIDPSSAESALRSAELSLSTDEADYHDAVEGLTPRKPTRPKSPSISHEPPSIPPSRRSNRISRQRNQNGPPLPPPSPRTKSHCRAPNSRSQSKPRASRTPSTRTSASAPPTKGRSSKRGPSSKRHGPARLNRRWHPPKHRSTPPKPKSPRTRTRS